MKPKIIVTVMRNYLASCVNFQMILYNVNVFADHSKYYKTLDDLYAGQAVNA